MDYLGRPIENPTIQIDVESGERFGITYIDQEENDHYPIIIHCSPTGSIERVICSLLEKSAIEKKEKPPMLPVWLAPTQVRVVPIAERHMEFAQNLARELRDAHIRVDVDDRPETVGKKIRNAGGEWTSFVVVIGDREMEGSELTVNVRETGQKVSMGVQELIDVINLETKGMPFRPLPLPLKLSKRVTF
jgi:threonyl-tRNA synthetase